MYCLIYDIHVHSNRQQHAMEQIFSDGGIHPQAIPVAVPVPPEIPPPPQEAPPHLYQQQLQQQQVGNNMWVTTRGWGGGAGAQQLVPNGLSHCHTKRRIGMCGILLLV